MKHPKHPNVPREFDLQAPAVDMETEDGRRKFAMEAYTGGIFDIGFGPAVIDVRSVEVPPGGVPIFRQHNPELYVGRSTAVMVTTGTIRIEGLLFDGIDEAEQVAKISDQGGRWQASVGVSISSDPDDLSYVEAKDSVHINGRMLAGPFLLLQRARLKESSFVPLGADSNTTAVALGDTVSATVDHHKTQEVSMSTQQKGPSIQDEQQRVAELSAAFKDDPAFALEAITKGLSLDQAKAARAEVLEAKLAEATAAHEAKLAEIQADHEAALAEAKKGTPPTSPAAQLAGFSHTTETVTLGETQDHATEWEAAVAAECATLRNLGSHGLKTRGLPALSHLSNDPRVRDANIRALAVRRAAIKNPQLHSAYLAAFNASVQPRGR